MFFCTLAKHAQGCTAVQLAREIRTSLLVPHNDASDREEFRASTPPRCLGTRSEASQKVGGCVLTEIADAGGALPSRRAGALAEPLLAGFSPSSEGCFMGRGEVTEHFLSDPTWRLNVLSASSEPKS